MSRTIFLVTGPSGAGKTTLTSALVRTRSGVTRGVTVTTRQRRPEEVDDKDYIFVSEEKFAEMKSAGSFFETDTAFGEFYGVPHDFDRQPGNLILIVTLAGARAIKKVYPKAKTIFILASSAERARQRVMARGAPHENDRIVGYAVECGAARAYDQEIGFDAVIRNNNFEDALRKLESIYTRRGKSTAHTVQSYRHEFPTYVSSRLAS